MNSNLNLRSFQHEAVWDLINKKRGMLGLPTGTGKTISAFSTYTYLKEKFPDLKLLFVTEKSLIRQVASQDLPTYFSGLKFSYIYDMSKKERLRAYKKWVEDEDILILNYASVRIDLEDMGAELKKINFNYMVIFDEASNFKNPNAEITKSVSILIRASKRAYAMTATPSTGTLEDIYNILNTMQLNPYSNKEEFNSMHCKFENRKMFNFRTGDRKRIIISKDGDREGTQVCYYSLSNGMGLKKPVKFLTKPSVGVFKPLHENNGSFCWVVPNRLVCKTSFMVSAADEPVSISVSIFDNPQKIGYKNIPLFREMVSSRMFIRAKNEIAQELPPVTVTYRYVDQSKEVGETIKKLYKSNNCAAAQIEIALCTPQNYNTSLNDCYMSDKVAEIIKFLRDDVSDEKVILYAQYTGVTKYLKMILESVFGEGCCAYATGEGLFDTQSEVERFLNSDKCRFLIGTDTIQKGLNIQSVNYIIPVICPNTFGSYSQLVGRISRIGGSYSPKNIVHFITRGTRDEDKLESLLSQVKLVHRVNEKLVENGLLPSGVLSKGLSEMDENQARKFLDKKFEERKNQYS